MAAPYEFKSYRDFIKAELDSKSFGRGGRKRLAEHLGVQKSYVSLVLGGKQDFNLEHGMRIAGFLGLSAADRRCFLAMMNRDRAGSVDLRAHYQEEVDRIRESRNRIKNQIRASEQVGEAEYAQYCGAWYHTVVHMCIRNPALRDAESIARFLGLEQGLVSRSLKLLESIGFAELVKGKWAPTVARFHVSKESPSLRMYHANARHLAVHALDQPRPKNLHYSLMLSLDAAAAEKVRAKVLELIKEIEPVIEKAGDTELLAVNLDLFKVGN